MTAFRKRWLALRNRLIARPGFQRLAGRFPPTRPLVRRRTKALFDLVAGFVYSQALAAAVELDLFQRLAEAPRDAAALAPLLGLSPARTTTLLEALVALDLLERLPGGRYALAELGAALLGTPGVRAMIAHHAMLYADLADPVALLRGEGGGEEGRGRLATYWAYARETAPGALSAEKLRPYSGLMAESQAAIAHLVLDAYPVGKHRALLDIGGGEGVFLAAAGARAKRLRLTLFDLPGVVEAAAARLAESGLTERATLRGGDFLRDPLPTGSDLASLVRVLHDHDDPVALAILKAARAALPPGGTLLVAEPMAGTKRAEPAGAAYFGLYLAAMGSGRPRTAAELTAMLREAGFAQIREVCTAVPLLVRVLAASVQNA